MEFTNEFRVSLPAEAAWDLSSGPGVMTDISRKPLDQFVACLQERLAAGREGGGGAAAPAAELAQAPAAPAAGPTAAAREPQAIPPESKPLDLPAVARGPVAERLVPVVLAALVLLGVARRLRRAWRHGQGGHRA
jgi:hypothetical protein